MALLSKASFCCKILYRVHLTANNTSRNVHQVLPNCDEIAVHALVTDVGFWGSKFACTGCRADFRLKCLFNMLLSLLMLAVQPWFQASINLPPMQDTYATFWMH